VSESGVTSHAAGLLPRSGASPGGAEEAELAAVLDEGGVAGAAGRHRRDALSALRHGRGARWAADITGLPLRYVARIATQNGIPLAPPEPALPAAYSLWPPLVPDRGRLILAEA
jgi:hypothetical protein